MTLFSEFDIDMLKCFDILCPQLLCQLFKAIGLPQWIVQGWSTFATQLKRILRIESNCSEPFSITNGVPQGCSISLIAVNLLHAVWVVCMQHQNPEIHCLTYIDDAHVYSLWKALGQFVVAVEVTKQFNQDGRTVVHEHKCHVWGSSPEILSHAQQLIPASGHTTAPVTLGTMMMTRSNVRNDVIEKRFADALCVATRLVMLSPDKNVRARLFACYITPRITWGVEATYPSQCLLRGPLRTRATECIFGVRRPLKCPEIVLTLLAHGHLCDPVQSVPYNIIVKICSQLRKDHRVR